MTNIWAIFEYLQKQNLILVQLELRQLPYLDVGETQRVLKTFQTTLKSVALVDIFGQQNGSIFDLKTLSVPKIANIDVRDIAAIDFEVVDSFAPKSKIPEKNYF